MKTRLKPWLACFTLTGASLATQAAWPDKPITLVVPFAAGGNTDAIARLTGEWLGKALNQNVVIDNKPGGNGAIAAEYVARAKGDGYTLFMASLPQMAILPRMQKVRYDPQTSFVPVSIIATNAFALAVSNNSPVNSLAELVALAKSKPGAVAYASAGSGSVSHLTMALLLQRAKLDMNHVPYKGGAPAVTDVIGGQVPFYFGNLAEILPHYKSGKLKVIAVSSPQRVAQLPKVPTVAEQGYPGFSTLTWNGIAAPAGTPKEALDAMSRALAPAAKDPVFVERLGAIGVDALCNSPAEFTTVLTRDVKQWADAVRLTGATID